MQLNAQLELQKEQQYKQFFNRYDADLAKRMEKHMDTVTVQEMEKKIKLD